MWSLFSISKCRTQSCPRVTIRGVLLTEYWVCIHMLKSTDKYYRYWHFMRIVACTRTKTRRWTGVQWTLTDHQWWWTPLCWIILYDFVVFNTFSCLKYQSTMTDSSSDSHRLVGYRCSCFTAVIHICYENIGRLCNILFSYIDGAIKFWFDRFLDHQYPF